MSVARRLEGPLEDLADQVGQGGGGGELLQLVADVALVLGAVGRERDGRPAVTAARRGTARRCRLGQRRQPLEGQRVEPLGRDQVQLEDRLAQVAVVLDAVELGGLELVGGDQAALDQDRDQRLVGRRSERRRRARSRSVGSSGDRGGLRRSPDVPARRFWGAVGSTSEISSDRRPAGGRSGTSADRHVDRDRSRSQGTGSRRQGCPGDVGVRCDLATGCQENPSSATRARAQTRRSTGDRSIRRTAPRRGSSGRSTGRRRVGPGARSGSLTSPAARRAADRGPAPASRGSRTTRRRSGGGSPRPSRDGSRAAG